MLLPASCPWFVGTRSIYEYVVGTCYKRSPYYFITMSTDQEKGQFTWAYSYYNTIYCNCLPLSKWSERDILTKISMIKWSNNKQGSSWGSHLQPGISMFVRHDINIIIIHAVMALSLYWILVWWNITKHNKSANKCIALIVHVSWGSESYGTACNLVQSLTILYTANQ